MNQFNAPLWGDEGFSAILSMHSLPEVIKIIINDTSPPLWNIFEWLVFNTLGTDEVYIRALSTMFFLITIFFAYKIGEFFWDKKTGFLAATLTFLNPFFFTYAFEGRMYSIMAAGVSGSMYFFSKILFAEKKVGKKYVFGYIIMTLWAIYSHHFAMFAVIIQGFWFIYAFFTNRKTTGKMFLGFIGVGIGYLPWLLPLYNQTKMVGTGFWLGKPKLSDITGMVMEYVAYGVKHTLSFPALTLTLSALALRNWSKDIKKSLYLLSWFLGPLILAFIVSQVFTPIFYKRYLLYVIPASMILLASARRFVSFPVIAIIIICFSIIDVYYFTHPTRPHFRDLRDFVVNTQNEGDYLINYNGTPHFLWESKYYGIPAPLYLPDKNQLPYFVGTALMKPEDIIYEIPNKVKRIGVITAGSIEEIKIAGYTETERKEWYGVKFVWYQYSDK